MFDLTKKHVLARKDHSKKGTIDKEIKPILDLINSKDEFYTTSSCAGRIVLMVEPKSGKKKDTEWLYVTHGFTTYDDIARALSDLPDETIWLRMETFIIHVAVKRLDEANKLMKLLVKVGLKHSGILSTGKRVIVEVVGNERLDVPIAVKKKLLINADYLRFLVDEANKKLGKSRERLNALYDALSIY